MSAEQVFALTSAIAVVAFLYSSVGHAGASGYIAVMTLAGLDPLAIKPTALALNILVALIATSQFYRRGHFSWPHFWPFAVLAVPMAFIGGYFNLPATIFKIVIGMILVGSAIQLLVRPAGVAAETTPPRRVAIPVGGALGLLAGLTGTGGGIFLTPLLLLMRWSTAKTAAGVSAPFILLNSTAGLLGNVSSTQHFPAFVIPIALAAGLAGLAGSYYGSVIFTQATVKRLLAVVLLIAGSKLLLTAGFLH